MALRISFKPGVKQSQCAARYFHDTVGSLVETMIDGLEERSYLIGGDKAPALRLRTWSTEELSEEVLNELFDWMVSLRADIHALQEEPCEQHMLAPLVTNWLAVRLGGADLFVELAFANLQAPDEEQAEFSLGMLRGRSVMISTDTLLYTWLDKDIFGLSIAGHGSYLLELVRDDEVATHGLRRAS